METPQDNCLLTETDVSKRLQVSLEALRHWRANQRGPKFVKLGVLVRYRPSDLEEWISSQPSGGETRGQVPIKPAIADADPAVSK
jgi:predicted DNA-binding transcriptional regulator AlpA